MSSPKSVERFFNYAFTIMLGLWCAGACLYGAARLTELDENPLVPLTIGLIGLSCLIVMSDVCRDIGKTRPNK